MLITTIRLDDLRADLSVENGNLTISLNRNRRAQNLLHLAAINNNFGTVFAVTGGSNIIFDSLGTAIEERESYFVGLVNEPDEDGRTPLWYASQNNNLSLAHLLLQYGANPNIIDDLSDLSPLHHAARSEQGTELARLLLNHGANLEITDADAQTPLHWAHMEGNTVMIDFLLRQRASPDARDDWQHTPAQGHMPRLEAQAFGLRPLSPATEIAEDECVGDWG